MGGEFLFVPTTFFIFIALNICAVLIQRQLFRHSFEMLETNKVVTGYAFVLILGFLMAGWDSGGTFRGFTGQFFMINYLSLLVVTLVLMPSSLWLVSRQKASLTAIVLVGVCLWAFLVFCTALTDGLDKINERGIVWFRVQAYHLTFIITVSAVFAIGLKRPLKA